MNEKGYPFTLMPGELIYEFESISAHKRIQKAVLFTAARNRKVFNLALVDVLDDGEISDQIESNNGDLYIVLATIFAITDHFLEKHPDCTVGFRGSDKRRHRLYRIAIARELSSISRKFDVYGEISGNLHPFKANIDYVNHFVRRHYDERS
jgi:hypothetical protein